VKERIEQFLRGPACSAFLGRFGIDPKRYWLLMDLFQKLSARGEVQDQLGRQNHALRVSAGWFFLITGVLSLLAILLRAPAMVVAGFALFLTAFTLMLVLISEAANSLVNPEEALSLSHQPINGSTYTAAKLSHLLRIVLYYVLGWNLFPALAAPLLANSRWFYLPLHLLIAITLGILIALFCCSIYGLVMRVVPARRMKAASYFVQAIPMVLIGFFQFSPRGTTRRIVEPVAAFVGPLATSHPWLLTFASAGVALAVMTIGLRSLSADYLIRASSMVHGQSNAKTKVRRSILGDIVRRLFGGQAGRAGFDYMRRMMLRDWQFRRHLLGVLPISVMMIFGLFSGTLKSPFDTGFSVTHFVPHALGYAITIICGVAQYGNDYKGIWLFLLVSDRRLVRFAQGIHASLWLTFIVVPTLVLLPVFAWKWGITDALLFAFMMVPAASVYLAIALRGIDGIPFGKQAAPVKDAAGQGFVKLVVFLIASAAAVGIQYLLFRSVVAVTIAIVVLTPVAYFLTQWSLRTLQTAIRHHLGTLSKTSTMIYTEVNFS
jgi:hypothetical protein